MRDRGDPARRGDPRPGRLRLPGGLGRRRLRRHRSTPRREPVGAYPRDQGARLDTARDRAPQSLPRRLEPGQRRHRDALRGLRRERGRRVSPARPAERRLEPARGGRRDHERRRRVPCRARLQPGTHERDGDARGAGPKAPRARRNARHRQRPDGCSRAAPGRGARRPSRGGERASRRLLRPGGDGHGARLGARRSRRRGRPRRDHRVPARAHAPPWCRASRSPRRSKGWDAPRGSSRSGCGRRPT